VTKAPQWAIDAAEQLFSEGLLRAIFNEAEFNRGDVSQIIYKHAATGHVRKLAGKLVELHLADHYSVISIRDGALDGCACLTCVTAQELKKVLEG